MFPEEGTVVEEEAEEVNCCCNCCQCGLVRACEDKIEEEARPPLAVVVLLVDSEDVVVVSWDRQPRKPSKAPNRNRIVRGGGGSVSDDEDVTAPTVQQISSAFS